jgi:hypothetical protein
MKIWLYINLIAALIICAFIFLTNLNRERATARSYTRALYYESKDETTSEYMKYYMILRPQYDTLDEEIKTKYLRVVGDTVFLGEASQKSKFLSLVLLILLSVSIINLMIIQKSANKTDVSNPSSPDR